MLNLPSRPEIKTLLVDDEEIALHRLKMALQAYPLIKIIGEVMDGKSAVDCINSQRPDLVFLDIQMPGFNGFEVINQLTHIPLIVFVTAYEEYAVRAFEKNSLDYLLKPVADDRLEITIQRVINNSAGEDDILQKIKKLFNEEKKEAIISTIPVKTGHKVTLVNVADIYFFEAKDKYVFIHTDDDEKLVEYPLTYLENRLPTQFVRVHRSYIINKLKIQEMQKYFKGTYLVIMNDLKKSKIKTAYSYADDIRTKLLLP